MPDEKPQNVRELIRKAGHGDESAFANLVDHFGPAVFRFILHMVNRREIAEDLYQETWARVYAHLPDYTDEGKFEAWLYRIANRLCLNYLRREKWRWLPWPQNSHSRALPDRTFGDSTGPRPPDQAIEEREQWRLIEKALQSMLLKQRQVFLLRMSSFSFREIAELLGRPLNTTLTQMRAAIQHIQKVLSEYYGSV